ncbi:hypothetical protein ANSO36C_19980 [Nostoc cf. commune SO-36]|uniref:Uncharacterized protein n=1 Tax=Nostoc cf. commune SO-36 TaxID=449208 RepID=A0ABN6Q1S3_NOSCO|nr:hypothetical protein ANSO36C_19980 [Nostoc cf. commune SO-36]
MTQVNYIERSLYIKLAYLLLIDLNRAKINLFSLKPVFAGGILVSFPLLSLSLRANTDVLKG